MTSQAETDNDATVHADPRRELALTFALIVLGGGGALFAASRVWLTLTAARQAPFAPLVVSVRGRSEFAALGGLAVVTLLGAVLMLVTGSVIRRLLAILLAAVSAATAGYAVAGYSTPSHRRLLSLIGGAQRVGDSPISVRNTSLWQSLTIVCSVLSLLGAVILFVRASRWTSGLSARYEAPAESAKSDDPWRSLDRGEDPTIGDD